MAVLSVAEMAVHLVVSLAGSLAEKKELTLVALMVVGSVHQRVGPKAVEMVVLSVGAMEMLSG